MDAILLPKNRYTWMLLAFQGGFINIGGLLCVHVFVSHITGFSAHFAMSLYDHQYLQTVYFLLVPMFFLFGAIFSGIVSEKRRVKNQPPVYIHILLFLSAMFLFLAILGVRGSFGIFGEPFNDFHDFILLCLLAFACGAQNALFTHYSNSIIRTTHLTGLTTDLGIGLAKYFIGKNVNEKRINRVRIELITSFILGSVAGAYIFPQLHFYSFLIPCLISLIVGFQLYITRKKLLKSNSF
ncbi:MAG: DUF1275 domain-containing protein [Bdellovibrionales bacterium]|nr:DUF1275 domain-containing protein [Bdellovibrionales bacterium]